MRAVLENEWVLDSVEEPRKNNLLSPFSGEEIIDRVAEQALEAGKSNRICLDWEKATDPITKNDKLAWKEDTYFRILAKISIETDLSDMLFNGVTGYRAQYYLSVEEGDRFNHILISKLRDAIKTQYNIRPNKLGVSWELVEASLVGKYSKIWIVGDGLGFEEKESLKATRWQNYENTNHFACRLTKNLAPQIDLKGAFINKNDINDSWLSEVKKNRSKNLYERGSDVGE